MEKVSKTFKISMLNHIETEPPKDSRLLDFSYLGDN